MQEALNMLYVAEEDIQRIIPNTPFLSRFVGMDIRIIFAAVAGVLFLLLMLTSWVIVCIVHNISHSMTKKTVKRFFGIRNLDKFEIIKMGKIGSLYFNPENVNNFRLEMPCWKKANTDGSRDRTKRFNKVIWRESVLWLHAGRVVYVLKTQDPWEMIFLVHSLRDGGLDIAPCQQEMDKQERLESGQKSSEEVINELLQDMDGDHEKFVEYCREKLASYGGTVSDAPQNSDGIDLFLHWKGRACVVKCLLADRDYLSGLEEIKTFRTCAVESFSDICMFITTGHTTVAAASYARNHDVEVICDERFVALMNEELQILPGKEFWRWELTQEDVRELLPDGIINT